MIQDSLTKYNERLPEKKWRIAGHDRKMILHLAMASPSVLRELEIHYSWHRHADSAFPHDLLSQLDFEPGSSKACPDAPPFWKDVMTVTSESLLLFFQRAIKDFDRKLPGNATRSAKRNAQLTPAQAGELLNLCTFMVWVQAEAERAYGQDTAARLRDLFWKG